VCWFPYSIQSWPNHSALGYETPANSIAWGLFSLAQRPVIQSQLRAELLQAFPDDSVPVTVESLNGLTYLDAVVREILRFHPVIEICARQAQTDDVMPLEKGFVGRDGKFRDHIEWVA
jgi:cytochrome P450